MKKAINGIVVLALMVTAGCSSQSAVTSSETQSQAPSPKPSAPASVPVAPEISQPAAPSGYGFDQWQKGPLGDVFFPFDSTVLGAEAQQQLNKDAEWLQSNSANNVRIEGHCDNRGTSEYNLALGERRAKTSREYLIRMGVASSRLEAVSFGEERPFETGNSEEAWSKNRRAHFVIKK